MATSETPMTELNGDTVKNRDAEKTNSEGHQVLRLQEGCLGIRITLKNELYGYDIPIPKGQKIYPEKTKVEPEKDKLKVKIFKETKFNLKAGMFR